MSEIIKRSSIFYVPNLIFAPGQLFSVRNSKKYGCWETPYVSKVFLVFHFSEFSCRLEKPNSTRSFQIFFCFVTR